MNMCQDTAESLATREEFFSMCLICVKEHAAVLLCKAAVTALSVCSEEL